MGTISTRRMARRWLVAVGAVAAATSLAAGVGWAQAPGGQGLVDVQVNKTRMVPGDFVALGFQSSPETLTGPVDIYLSLTQPSGQTDYLTSSGDFVAGAEPFERNVAIVAETRALGGFFFPVDLPFGTYVVRAFLAHAGTNPAVDSNRASPVSSVDVAFTALSEIQQLILDARGNPDLIGVLWLADVSEKNEVWTYVDTRYVFQNGNLLSTEAAVSAADGLPPKVDPAALTPQAGLDTLGARFGTPSRVEPVDAAPEFVAATYPVGLQVLLLNGRLVAATTSAAALPPLDGFVAGFYTQVLGRSPASAEIAAWVGFLRGQPGSPGAQAMVQGFFNSVENLHRPMTLATYVRLLYRTILQREPAPAEVDAWLTHGMLPVLNQLIPGFVNSPEFQQLLLTTPPSAIISRLYRNVLGRTESPEENAAWVAWLAAGGTFDGLAVGFFNSVEYLGGTRSLAEHVTILYRTFLGREPDAAGLTGWLDHIAAGLGAIQLGFTLSPEFQGRVERLFQ